jgi:penicillin-binding protein 1A
MATPDTAPASPARRKRAGLVTWLVRLLLLGLLGAGAGAAALAGLVLHYDHDLPKFDSLIDYRPKQVTRVYCSDGKPCGEFFHERRTVLKKEEIPQLMKQAVISAEDANFYTHDGLDYPHIAWALFRDVFHIGIRSGASTITQQVVKTFLVGSERKLSRKIKEAILARRLEKNLSKDDILSLYLNQIYFGQNRYGIEEASQFYFGHSARTLSLAEASILGGIPQSPNRLNPVSNITKAKWRQTYVLGQMARNGYITPAQAELEVKRPIALAAQSAPATGAYYLEDVRKGLEASYGEEVLYEGGLSVQIAMNPELQRAADLSVDKGLRELDKRQGYRGPLAKLAPAGSPAPSATADDDDDDDAASPDDEEPAAGAPAKAPAKALPNATAAATLDGLKQAMAERLGLAQARSATARIGWDLSRVTPEAVAKGLGAVALQARVRTLAGGARVGGAVVAVDDAKNTAQVDLGSTLAELKLDDLKWARPFDPVKRTSRPAKVSQVLAVGDVVRVQLGDLPKDAKDPIAAQLDQDPLVQGALVSIDPLTRHVVALVGGDDFGKSAFNRATQAHRQPGSSFKPYAYAGALASGRFTLATQLNDAPYIVRDPWTGKEWKPVNFEKDSFEGPVSLRKALAISSNTVAVRIAEAIGPDAIIDMARRAGITAPIPQNLTIVLGTAEVTPLEHANAYTTFATGGKRADPLMVLKVTDRSGKTLEEHKAEPVETMPPTVAYLITEMMRAVVQEGTGMSAQKLGRPVVGKTGTAQEQRDAWFCGFTPDLVTVAWVGFDNHDRLGHEETGAHAALPIWLTYMKAAEEGRPSVDFAPPPGIIQVRIEPRSGLLSADPGGGRLEYFVDGTQPKEMAPAGDNAAATDFFFTDPSRKP